MIVALRPRMFWASAGALTCLWMALMSPQIARGDATAEPSHGAQDAQAIAPGREDLFAAMLGRGAALPDACTFTTGQIERTFVRGVYDCPGGEVVLELRHPSAAPADAARTAKLAIVTTRGTPPAALVATLLQRIREREAEFDWPKITRVRSTAEPGCLTMAPLPSILDPYFPGCYPLASAVLVGLAQILVMVLGLAYGLIRLYRTASSPDAG